MDEFPAVTDKLDTVVFLSEVKRWNAVGVGHFGLQKSPWNSFYARYDQIVSCGDQFLSILLSYFHSSSVDEFQNIFHNTSRDLFKSNNSFSILLHVALKKLAKERTCGGKNISVSFELSVVVRHQSNVAQIILFSLNVEALHQFHTERPLFSGWDGLYVFHILQNFLVSEGSFCSNFSDIVAYSRKKSKRIRKRK